MWQENSKHGGAWGYAEIKITLGPELISPILDIS